MRLADELNQGQVKGKFKGQGQPPNERAIARDKPTRVQPEGEARHDCEVLGPIPPLMERRNRWYRSQLLVSAARIRERQQVLISAQHWLQTNAERSLRWHIDIDPSEQV